GVCHRTSLEACSLALGCEPEFSNPLQGSSKAKSSKTKSADGAESRFDNPQSCFPLPVCRSFKESFKKNKNKPDKKGQHQALIPKTDFSGDPDQAHWTSDFDHIASHAQVDPSRKRLVLKARRDNVKTKSGGGFGATVSSTRWNRYGTFSAKLKSGTTGPGIVTAMMLSNPILGEEITIEITGRDPKTVITDLFRHSAKDTKPSSSWLPDVMPIVPTFPLDGFRTRTRKLKDMIMRTKPNKALITDTVVLQKAESDDDQDYIDTLEESHHLKKDTTQHDMVYKIEWTPDQIQWSVDNQVLRTLTSKDLHKHKGYGIPSHPMQLQLTIWDAGYNPETRAWAGGETNYGKNDEKEYATLVEWVDISCQDPKEIKRNPWPGVEASKRLEQAKKQEKKEREQREKEEKKVKKDQAEAEKKEKLQFGGSKLNVSSTKMGWIFGVGGGIAKQQAHLHHNKWYTLFSEDESGFVTRVLDSLVQSLLRWSFILVALVGSAAYLTDSTSTQKHRRPHDIPSAGVEESVSTGTQRHRRPYEISSPGIEESVSTGTQRHRGQYEIPSTGGEESVSTGTQRHRHPHDISLTSEEDPLSTGTQKHGYPYDISSTSVDNPVPISTQIHGYPYDIPSAGVEDPVSASTQKLGYPHDISLTSEEDPVSISTQRHGYPYDIPSPGMEDPASISAQRHGYPYDIPSSTVEDPVSTSTRKHRHPFDLPSTEEDQ
ncbi:hypothetical protein BGZ46_004143, partial [Entomortierella lignicola]